MSVDKYWLLLTEVYAIAALLSLAVSLAACALLAMKVVRTMRRLKGRIRTLAAGPRRAAESARAVGSRVTPRAERTVERARATARNLAQAIKTIGALSTGTGEKVR